MRFSSFQKRFPLDYLTSESCVRSVPKLPRYSNRTPIRSANRPCISGVLFLPYPVSTHFISFPILICFHTAQSCQCKCLHWVKLTSDQARFQSTKSTSGFKKETNIYSSYIVRSRKINKSVRHPTVHEQLW